MNISVLNTRYGTSSDAEGRYELLLFDRNKPVDLLYTCIGYRDTVVSLTPRMLQNDSVGISFVMRRMDYDLQEVGVSASRDFYRSGRSTYIADVDFANGKILVLENRKQSVLTLLDGEGNVTASTVFSRNYDELYTDCFGNHILVGRDSCLQVYFDEKGKALPVLKEQAVSWASRPINAGKTQKLNVYEFDKDQVLVSGFKTICFEKYDGAWLDFVVANRRGEMLWKEYDMVEGGMANDRVFNTIELYLSALIAKEEALKRLQYEQPNNQICILNQSVIDRFLHFIEAVEIRKEENDG